MLNFFSSMKIFQSTQDFNYFGSQVDNYGNVMFFVM